MSSISKKRFARRHLAAVIAVVAAATCACSTSSGEGPKGAAKNGKLSSIQFINPLPNYPAWRKIGDCMKDAAKERGVSLKESGPTGSALDATVMVQQVQQAISNKVGAIVTFPASDGFGPVLKQAKSKGIVTGTLYATGPVAKSVDVNLGPDWGELGSTVIQAISKQPGQHVVGLVAQADTGLGKSWLDGVKAAAEKTDNVKISGEVYTGDDAAKALPQVNALLRAHPDITDIATHMGTTTPGAVAAIKAQGLKGKTFLVAGGHDNGGTEAIQEGTARLMLLQDVCSVGKDIANDVIDVAAGRKPAALTTKVVVVPKDQVQGYLDKGWS